MDSMTKSTAEACEQAALKEDRYARRDAATRARQRKNGEQREPQLIGFGASSRQLERKEAGLLEKDDASALEPHGWCTARVREPVRTQRANLTR